jgi:hypothetical protein
VGVEVEGEPVKNKYHYHVVSRMFELPELKLLVDAIQSSKFITEKKSNTLIKKLEKLDEADWTVLYFNGLKIKKVAGEKKYSPAALSLMNKGQFFI